MQWKWEGGYRFYGVLGCPPLSISTRKIVHNGLFIQNRFQCFHWLYLTVKRQEGGLVDHRHDTRLPSSVSVHGGAGARSIDRDWAAPGR